MVFCGSLLNTEELRFLRVVSGIWVCSAGAIPFAFGIMTNTMKEQFNLTQGELTTVSTVGTVFGSFALPAGFIWDHYGPKPVLLTAGIACAVGFAGMSLSFADIAPHSVLMLCAWNLLMAMPAAWMDIGSMMTNLFCFPLNNGDIVVLQKTFLGLGSTIISLYYTGWFHDAGANGMVWYCAFTSVYVFIILMFGAAVLDLPNYVYQERRIVHSNCASHHGKGERADAAMMEKEQAELAEALTDEDRYLMTVPADRRRMRVGLLLLGVMTLFLIGCSLAEAVMGPRMGSTAKAIIAAVTMLLAASFLIMPFMPSTSKGQITASTHLLLPGGAPNSVSGGAAVVVDDDQPPPPPTATVDIKYDFTFKQSIRRPDLWLMWWTNFCVWGSGATVIANSAQIYRSINHNEFVSSTNAFFVASIGLGSALGRIICGLLDQHVLQKKGLPTTLLFPISAVVGAVGMLLFLVMPPAGLVVPFAIFGSAFGWSWAATVLVARRIFRRDLGKQYNWIFTAPMVSSIALNRGVFGTLFDRTARAQGRSIHCSGVVCVEGAIATMAALCVTAAVAASVLHIRWARFLRQQQQSRHDES